LSGRGKDKGIWVDEGTIASKARPMSAIEQGKTDCHWGAVYALIGGGKGGDS